MSSATVRFVGLDLRSLRPSVRPMLFVLVFGAVFAAQLHSADVVAPFFMLASAFTAPRLLFNNDERGRLDTLYTALGITRARVVLGRYATCLALTLAGAAVGLLVAPAVSAALHAQPDARALLVSTAGALVACAVLLGLQLPIYFTLGHHRARIVILIPTLAVAAVLAFVAVRDRAAFARGLADVAHEPLLWAASGLAVCVAAIAVSGVLSTRFYRRRSL